MRAIVICIDFVRLPFDKLSNTLGIHLSAVVAITVILYLSSLRLWFGEKESRLSIFCKKKNKNK